MFWSHYGPEKNRELVKFSGFEIILDEMDFRAEESHQIVLEKAI